MLTLLYGGGRDKFVETSFSTNITLLSCFLLRTKILENLIEVRTVYAWRHLYMCMHSVYDKNQKRV